MSCRTLLGNDPGGRAVLVSPRRTNLCRGHSPGMGRSSQPATPTPRGNTLDGQLRLSYRQVLRNGAMGIDQCAFMGTHFGVSSANVRKAYMKFAPGGGMVDEDTYLAIMEHAMRESSFRASERPRMLSKNSAVLHKELSLNPFVKLPVVLPGRIKEESLSPERQAHKNVNPATSPANSKGAKLQSRLLTPTQRLNLSQEREFGVSTPLITPGGGASGRRSRSVPPMLSADGLDSSLDSKRPGSAFYMKPYTPTGSLKAFKRTQIDNNVPQNVRQVLLNPLQFQHRPPTVRQTSPELAAIFNRTKAALRGVSRMEAIEALTSTGEGNVSTAVALNHPSSVINCKNGLQVLGLNMQDDEVRALAEECRALTPDGSGVKILPLVAALIPLAGRLNVEEANIIPQQFLHFKRQRLKFTDALSDKEVNILKLMRKKLIAVCQGGAAALRKSFKLLDQNGTGRCDVKEMVTALELQGLGISAVDAEVLYLILDPQGCGMDYNAFTAMMMPPDIAEAQSQMVQIGYVRNQSKSRQGLRDRQTGGSEKAHVKTKPEPGEVEKFMANLTSENVIQILKNRVALALKSGPGAIRKWFSLFDKDGNNEIDLCELKDLLVDFGLNLSDNQVQDLMKKIDTNHNGLLDQAEIIAALLPADQFSLTASNMELKDPYEVGKPTTSGTGNNIQGEELRKFLRDKLIRMFVKKSDKQSTGYQIREAISRFDTNKDGSMSKIELRKAMNGLGLSVDDEMVTQLISLYGGEEGELGSVDYSKFVADVDPLAFNFVFSAGYSAMSGSFDKVEKEAIASLSDPPTKIRNTLKAGLRARQKRDGMGKLIREIQAYGDSEGKLDLTSFRAMLLRLVCYLRSICTQHQYACQAFGVPRPSLVSLLVFLMCENM